MTALDTLQALPGIRRAWPGTHGTIVFEQQDSRGRLRAGRIDPAGTARLTGYATDPMLPDLAPPETGELVVHRLNRRAVILGKDQVIKSLRPGKAERVANASMQVGGLCRTAGLDAARVLATTPAQIRFSRLPGRTLQRLGAAGLDGWARFAESWPALARQQAGLPAHSASDEVAVLMHWLAVTERFGALAELPRLQRAVTRTCRDLGAAADPAAVLHRDLHDGQLLWDGKRLSVLDLDTAARGEAALDLGNLWAHIELRGVQGLFPQATRDRVFAHLDRLAPQLDIGPARFECYRQAARLRLAFVYAFRPDARVWLDRWIAVCLRSANSA